jgi:hypothetical protein
MNFHQVLDNHGKLDNEQQSERLASYLERRRK